MTAIEYDSECCAWNGDLEHGPKLRAGLVFGANQHGKDEFGELLLQVLERGPLKLDLFWLKNASKSWFYEGNWLKIGVI